MFTTVKEKCKGVWTRAQEEGESLTDYVLAKHQTSTQLRK